jgi:16S rRNA (adenine1518-N6/adenine1519-N6)-dimethyltransferase
MLQKELCEKLILGNSYLSIILKFIFNIEILFHVPPEAFTPKPKVYSSFIFMKKHNEIIIENKHKLFNLLKRLFENKNKKIINILNLKNNDNIPEYIKELRPMHCSMEDFILLSNLLK